MAVSVVVAAVRPSKLKQGARYFVSVDVSLIVLGLRDVLRTIGPLLKLAGLGAVRQPQLLLCFALRLLAPAPGKFSLCHYERRGCRRLSSNQIVLALTSALPLRLLLF